MDWIRANYDRVAVLAAALFLVACSFFIWRSAAQFGTDFAAFKLSPPPGKRAPCQSDRELEQATEKLRQPAQWTFSGRSGLFVPEKHFIGANGLPATLQTTEVHPPVPNEWLEQFDLPIADGDVLTQDPDGDGFTQPGGMAGSHESDRQEIRIRISSRS